VSRLESQPPKSRRLIAQSFRPAGFSREDQSDLLTQDRAPILGGAPDDVPVDAEVGVNKNIAKGDDLRPRHLGLAGLQLLGDSCGRLADNGQFLNTALRSISDC
jgi:hypothetical protein